MKVLHLLETTNRGGAEILTLDICKNAKENGLDLIFVSLGKGDLDTEFENSGVTYFKLNRRYPLDLSIVFKLRNIIKKYNIKIIHSHLVVVAVHAYFATRGLNVKNILTHHGFSSIRKIKDEVWEKYLISRMAINIAVSNSFLEKLKAEKAYKIDSGFLVIYNGVDTKKFDCDNISEFAKSPSFITLGMVGNFINNKDQITICKALIDVKKVYPNIKFLFVGSRNSKFPDEYDRCVNFCKENYLLENVLFLGKRNDVYKILKSLDIFVFSSLNESFGIAPIEAMICGIPVILSDIDSLREISHNGKYALLYKSGDEKDLAEKIIFLIGNNNLRKRLSEEGKYYAIDKFSIENHIKKLINVYKSII